MTNKISKCPNCSEKMKKGKKNTRYRYTASGLKNVSLTGIDVYTCECGEEVAWIPDIGVLHRQIAIAILKKPILLEGDELKFLRKHFRLKASELAVKLYVTKQTLSRWENKRERLGKANDRLVRMYFLLQCVEEISNESPRSKRSDIVENAINELNNLFEQELGTRKRKKFEITIPAMALRSNVNPLKAIPVH